MKRIYLFSLLVLCSIAMTWAQPKQLYVLHTSDMHSRIEPISAKAADRNAGKGGVVRRATFVQQYREQHPGTLLFDCGDFSQGTPYYNFFKGEVEVKAMNLMKYDAVAIGNHEFDFGLDNMVRLFSMAQFPVVCANYDFTGTVLQDIVKPYVVLEREGLRIGVFGLSPKLEGLVQAEKCVGVTYHDPVQVATEVVNRLRQQEHCDVVICLSHLGILKGGDTSGDYDNRLIAHTSGIDLLLGGHTHTFMEKPEMLLNANGQQIPVLHSGNNGVYVGQVTLTLDCIQK